MNQSIFDKASASFTFYNRLFKALSLNDILYQAGRAKLVKDMTTLEYQDYAVMLASNVKDSMK